MADAGPSCARSGSDPLPIAGTPNTSVSVAAKYRTNWSTLSTPSARNRLPMPATGSSSTTCSGVSMFSCSSGLIMVPTRWFEERQRCWRRLEELLDAISRRGLGSLTRPELQELGLLYRQIASDLAVVRENVGGVGSAEYLNTLLARAHHTIY